MVTKEIVIRCPHCKSKKVNKCGKNTGKQRYICMNPDCKHKTFYSEYTYKACNPEVRQRVLDWAADGSGTRAIARQEKIHRDTVTSILKKTEKWVENVNKKYFEEHKNATISIEIDEMWSYVNKKTKQCWLWWAIDHENKTPVAFWFGTRKHKNLDKLLKLLQPLDIGNIYTDGNYAYIQRISGKKLIIGKKNTQRIERKHLSLRTWNSRLVRRGIRFSKSKQMHKISLGYTINTRMFGRSYSFI
jgi:IS1 family transposase/transposase-like protein